MKFLKLKLFLEEKETSQRKDCLNYLNKRKERILKKFWKCIEEHSKIENKRVVVPYFFYYFKPYDRYSSNFCLRTDLLLEVFIQFLNEQDYDSIISIEIPCKGSGRYLVLTPKDK